jgi:two-component system NtrC family sensor kinase
VQLLVRAVLEQGPYLVDVARNGFEACDRVRQGTYDAIVCDIFMPSMDGAAFYAALRECDPEQAERVIFVTGATLSAEKRAWLKQTGRPLVHKPFDIEEFERVVDAVANADLEPAGNA